jgi:signal transduction histidine kinase
MYISIKTKFILLLSVLMAAVLGVQFYLNYQTQQDVFDELALIYNDFNQLTDNYLLHLPPPPWNVKESKISGGGARRHVVTPDRIIIDVNDNKDQQQVITAAADSECNIILDHVIQVRSTGQKLDSLRGKMRMIYNHPDLAKADSLLKGKTAFIHNGISGERASRLELFIPDFSVPAQPKVVKYRYNETVLHKMMNDMRTRNLLATLVLFGFSITGIVMVTRKFLKPIDGLKHAFAGVVNGDLDVRVDSKNKDEMGDLARSFNQMVDELRKNKQKEELLQRQERLVSLGELSAGVAHEIKNPLNTINLTIDHLKDALFIAKNKKAVDYIGNIQQEVQRLDKLVTNFLNYVRSETLEKCETNIQALIQEILALYEREITKAGISVQNTVDNAFVVSADRERLKTALVNIIINAIQAMPDGGLLSIHTNKEQQWLIIQDSGCGIPEKLLEKVFDPFYTTKAGGTGLGLPTAYKIISEHEGQLTIDSRENEGTRVTIQFN